MKGAVAHAADRVRRTFGQVIVNAVDKPTMRLGLTLQHGQKTRTIVVVPFRIPTSGGQQRGQDVRVLHKRISALPNRRPTRPMRHQRGVQTGIPVSPFTTGKLRALFGSEKHQRVTRFAGGFQCSENLAHLPVHVGNLGEVLGEIDPRARRVREVRRQLQLLGGIL